MGIALHVTSVYKFLHVRLITSHSCTVTALSLCGFSDPLCFRFYLWYRWSRRPCAICVSFLLFTNCSLLTLVTVHLAKRSSGLLLTICMLYISLNRTTMCHIVIMLNDTHPYRIVHNRIYNFVADKNTYLHAVKVPWYNHLFLLEKLWRDGRRWGA